MSKKKVIKYSHDKIKSNYKKFKQKKSSRLDENLEKYVNNVEIIVNNTTPTTMI